MDQKLLLACLFSLLLTFPAHADERILSIYCEYPPQERFQEGSKVGLIYDQVWEMMKRTNISKPIQIVSWKRGLIEVTTKPDIGLFPTTRTPERESLFHWVGPILRLTWAFYAHADSGLTINSLDDARKVRAIGTYANDSREMWLKAQNFTNLVSVMDNVTNLKKLYAHRIDLMVGSPSVTNRWPEIYGYDPDKMVKVYTFKTVDLYLALSKDTSMDTVWKLQKAFRDMVEDGTVQTQYNKWVPGLIPPTAD